MVPIFGEPNKILEENQKPRVEAKVQLVSAFDKFNS